MTKSTIITAHLPTTQHKSYQHCKLMRLDGIQFAGYSAGM